MLIAVPTGVKYFNWIGTLWGGSISIKAPMLFALGFLFSFILGGIIGVMVASAPIDFHVHDSYFVVANFHYVLFGGSVFAPFAGVCYWFPKVFGRVLSEGWGRAHFVMMFVGFHVTFMVQQGPRHPPMADPTGGRNPTAQLDRWPRSPMADPTDG